MKFRYTTESVYRVRIAKPATLRARPPTGEIDGREFLSRDAARNATFAIRASRTARSRITRYRDERRAPRAGSAVVDFLDEANSLPEEESPRDPRRIAISIRALPSPARKGEDLSFSIPAFRFPRVLLAPVSRETPRRDRVRRNYPPSPSPGSTFPSLLLLSPPLARRCRARLAATGVSAQQFPIPRARPPIVETKRKRLMKYYATRQCMPAHAALPLIRTRENRPFPGGQDGPRARADSQRRCNVTSIRYPLSERIPRRPPPSSPLLPLPIRVLSIPYLVPLPAAVRSYLMYGTPLHRANVRRSFGIRR